MLDGSISAEISKAPANEPPKRRPNAFFHSARKKFANLFKSNQQSKQENSSDVMNLSLTRRKLLELGVAGASAVLTQTALPTGDAKAKTLVDTLASLGAQPQEGTVEQKEKTPFSPKVTIIDAAPAVPTEGLKQNEFISNEDMLKRMLGDNYISKEQLVAEFGEDYKAKWKQVIDKYPQAILMDWVHTYFSHGENVAEVMKKTWEQMGLKSNGLHVIPLQKIFDDTSVTQMNDSLANPGYSLDFNPERIIKLLKQDQNRVINCSFQVGNVDVFAEKKRLQIPEPDIPSVFYALIKGDNEYKEIKDRIYLGEKGKTYGVISTGKNLIPMDEQGNELSSVTPEEFAEINKVKTEEAKRKAQVVNVENIPIKITGSYAKDKAAENLPKLFEVCKAYPDKLFIVAAGNEGEDFRMVLDTLRKEIPEKVPNNMLIVGEWTRYGDYANGPQHAVYGADMYVDNNSLGIFSGSSYSTPVISAFAEKLFSEGKTLEEVKTLLIASTISSEYKDVEGNKNFARVFHPSKIEEREKYPF